MIGRQDRDLARVAQLLEEAARELRKLAGTCGTELDPLAKPEAECRRPASERADENPDMPSPPIANVKLLLTAVEFADLLSIHPRTLRRWLADPRMKLPKPMGKGRVLRWRLSEAIAWVEGGRK